MRPFRTRPIAILLPVACALLFSVARGDDELCGKCGTTGRVQNDLPAGALRMEEGVEYCSVFMRSDRRALGLDWLVCEKCDAPEQQERARRAFERELGKRKKWLSDREAEVDGPVGHEVDHIQTRHFVISWDIPRIKVGNRTYNRHEAMHLYAERMEELFDEIMELHGITERRTAGTIHHLYLLESEKDAGNLVRSLGMSGSGGRVSQYGRNSRMVTHRSQTNLRRDEDFHQFLCHVVSHHIHNDVEICQNWLVKRYGWVFEGLAHFIEIRKFGPPNTWCHQEVGSGIVHWKGKGWEANVKKAVLRGDHVPISNLFGKAADTLTPREHQFAWAYIDYLMWLDPGKMPAMLRHMKGPQLPDRDAIQKAYGLSVPKLQEGFEDFVRAEYSTRSKKGPQPREPRTQSG